MTLSINKKIIFKIIRFGLVGVFNTIFDIAVLNGLISLFGISDPFIFSVYKGISFGFALVASYFLNTYFTFNLKHTSQKGFFIFLFFGLIGFIVNIVLSSIAFYILSMYSNVLSIHLIATISAIVGAIFGAVINYINYSYFVFK